MQKPPSENLDAWRDERARLVAKFKGDGFSVARLQPQESIAGTLAGWIRLNSGYSSWTPSSRSMSRRRKETLIATEKKDVLTPAGEWWKHL